MYMSEVTSLICHCRNQKEFEPLNLRDLKKWIKDGRINPEEPIDMRHLWESGVIGKPKHGVKLLGTVRAALACRCLTLLLGQGEL